MVTATLAISLSRPAPSRLNQLFIEQGDPEPGEGYLSRAGMFLALLDLVENQDPAERTNCLSGGRGTTLYVYRYDLSLPYTLHVTHGELGDRRVEDDLVFTEKIRVNMQGEVNLKYPNFGVVDTAWLGGKVWDKDGMEISPPAPTTTSSSVIFPDRLYGTLLISYKIKRDAYFLPLVARPEAEENKYSSVAYAVHRGGVDWMEIRIPEQLEKTGKVCYGGGGTLGGHEGPEDPDGPPSAPHADAEIGIDYCSQEVLYDQTKD